MIMLNKEYKGSSPPNLEVGLEVVVFLWCFCNVRNHSQDPRTLHRQAEINDGQHEYFDRLGANEIISFTLNFYKDHLENSKLCFQQHLIWIRGSFQTRSQLG